MRTHHLLLLLCLPMLASGPDPAVAVAPGSRHAIPPNPKTGAHGFPDAPQAPLRLPRYLSVVDPLEEESEPVLLSRKAKPPPANPVPERP